MRTTDSAQIGARALTLALVGVILAGCVAGAAAGTPPASVGQPSATPTGTASPTPDPTPSPPTPSPATPSHSAKPSATARPTRAATPAPTCALQTLASMTEAQRIGQLFMVGLADDRLSATLRDAIATYHFGSVLFTKKTTAGVTVLRAVSNAVQATATESATHGVPFFIAANQEGGLVQALSGLGFDVMPSALSQGSLSPAQLQTAATRWGRQLQEAGVNLDLAPVADVVPPGTDDQNAPIGELDREYGHDPATVANHVAAFIAGMRAAGVGTTAKHFPGLGRVAGNTDYTSAVVDSVTTRHDPYLEPFARAVASRVPFVMISLATYTQIDPQHLAAFSNTVINGMLRGDLGFRGVVMSDSLGATAVTSLSPATRAIRFLDAGGDMIVLNQVDQAMAMASAIGAFAATTDWFKARVDNAAWHVLRAKEAAGLLTCGG
jgi:beta-N-acetylhexosaminidase